MKADEIVKLTRGRIRDLVATQRELTDVPYSGRNRRSSVRKYFPATVELREVGDEATAQWFGTCRDISEGGLGVVCDCDFSLGTQLEISVHLAEATLWGKGTVRYCREQNGEYLIGLQFDFES